MRSKHLSFGSLAEGTCKAEDWIHGLAWALGRLQLTREDRTKFRQIMAEYESADLDLADPELPAWTLDELCIIAENYLPPYAYLGTLEGDGADFGVWLMGDFDQQDVPRFSDLSELPTGYTGEACTVTDHGNITLWAVTRGRAREVWSLV